MDKKVMFAVAGSGKTKFIIEELSLDKRFLILTYTNNNISEIKNRIMYKFGYFPNNIKLQTYFSFLHSFCYKPFLSYRVKDKGINFKTPPKSTFTLPRTNPMFYVDCSRRLYHCRIAKLCEMQKILLDINTRIEKYYDCLFVDEIQDFAGHDFNLLKSITKANCEILFVGDFYQHTFDTSNDGPVNKSIFNDYDSYKKLFKDMGLTVDTKTLQNSHRCSKTVCDFIQNKIGITISATSNKATCIQTITKQSEADKIIKDDAIVKLFFKEYDEYNCNSQNWGKSKGLDHYSDVCVILNKKTKKAFDKNNLSSLPQSTKNKLYVACSRAKNNLYFISSELIKKYEKKP